MSAAWTPENGKCFFGAHPEEGYARKDEKGEFQPSCYACAKQEIRKVNKEKPNAKKSEFD